MAGTRLGRMDVRGVRSTQTVLNLIAAADHCTRLDYDSCACDNGYCGHSKSTSFFLNKSFGKKWIKNNKIDKKKTLTKSFEEILPKLNIYKKKKELHVITNSYLNNTCGKAPVGARHQCRFGYDFEQATWQTTWVVEFLMIRWRLRVKLIVFDTLLKLIYLIHVLSCISILI